MLEGHDRVATQQRMQSAMQELQASGGEMAQIAKAKEIATHSKRDGIALLKSQFEDALVEDTDYVSIRSSADRKQAFEAESRKYDHDDDSFDDDEFLDDPTLDDLHDKRLAEMKRIVAEKRAEAEKKKKISDGDYREIVQDEFLPTVTSLERVAVHFYHPEFETCMIMDQVLREIAVVHKEVKFVKINAEKAPFFVRKLLIKVLPSVVFFEDGEAMDRLVGFQGLDEKHAQKPKIRVIEDRIAATGFIMSSPFGTYEDDADESSDEDDDYEYGGDHGGGATDDGEDGDVVDDVLVWSRCEAW
jgi:thiol-disulfide isomerase/thioredoxin